MKVGSWNNSSGCEGDVEVRLLVILDHYVRLRNHFRFDLPFWKEAFVLGNDQYIVLKEVVGKFLKFYGFGSWYLDSMFIKILEDLGDVLFSFHCVKYVFVLSVGTITRLEQGRSFSSS